MSPVKRVAKSRQLTVHADLKLTRAGRSFVGGVRVKLLESIDRDGSITRAAKRVGLSYKGAWDAVDAMNNVSPQPLVVRSVGGRAGGGTQLTPYGREVVRLYRQLEAGHQRVMSGLQREMHDVERVEALLQTIALQTSARNQYAGTVKRLRRGAVNAEIELDIGDGLAVVASITNEAVEDLGLAKGVRAYALIKSSFVVLTPDRSVRISARNKLSGQVSAIVKGAINSEVKLALPGERSVIAIVTNESVRELGLKKGDDCTALIKASHVLIAVNR